jgi:Transposase DDE domain
VQTNKDYSMKTNSKKKDARFSSIIEEKLKTIPINKISRQSGFCKRKPKKIKPKQLIISFIQTICASKKNTYSNWACQLGVLINTTVSKQAVSKKIKEPLVIFLKLLLKTIMEESLKTKIKAEFCNKLKQFNRVLLQDSTSIKLDDKLSKDYPGNKNWCSKDYAVMKIQSTYDIIRRKFLALEITNFRRNDQSYSSEILNIARAGDLVIRDLGYFVLSVLKELLNKKIYFISRFRKDVNIYTEEEKLIDLASMLKKRGSLDIELFAGEKDKLPVRLIAIPVEKAVADQRRRKAKKNRDRRTRPGKKHLFLLGWDIFITNVEKQKLQGNDITMLYRIRWRIEIIYKSWKSYIRITNLPEGTNKIRVESFIYSLLIFILLFQVHFYEYYLQIQKLKSSQQISLIKLMQYIVNNITLIIYLSYLNNTSYKNNLLSKQILYYCRYEKRKDRLNYEQLLQKLG